VKLPAWTFDSQADYRARREFLSYSTAKHGIEQSLAHLRAYEMAPREATAAMILGTAIHAATLEPEEFRSRYLIAPKVDRRTKDGKAEWESFLTHAVGREVIPADDHQVADQAAAAVRAHPLAGELIADATIESSIYWQDEESGVLCKARPDAYCQKTGTLVDLKSTLSASPREFSRSIFSMGYHRQLAFYRMALEAVGFPVNRVVLIAVEKAPPFGVNVFELEHDSLALGAHQIREFFPKYAAAKAADHWPGYSVETHKVSPPTWAFE